MGPTGRFGRRVLAAASAARSGGRRDLSAGRQTNPVASAEEVAATALVLAPRVQLGRLARGRCTRLARVGVLVGILFGGLLPASASATGVGLGSLLAEPSLTESSPAPPVSSATLGYSLKPSSTEPYAVCPPPTSGHAGCLSVVNPQPVKTASGYRATSAGPLLEGGGEKEGLAPNELREAYKIPVTGGSTQTVAIVNAYDDPKAEADLNSYRERYGLDYKSGVTACTKANGCFKKFNQEGKEEDYPTDKYPEISGTGKVEDWGLEISLDLEMVSAICPECKILLVEANNSQMSSLEEAETEAVWVESEYSESKKITTEVSNSWGGYEQSDEETIDAHFGYRDVPTTASAGDGGYGTEYPAEGVAYPAASKDVIAVGGTVLKKKPGSERGWEETVWPYTGGGCSEFESKPSWQTDPGCANRTDNDVAAVASDEESPVSAYDSYEYESGGVGTGKLGWMLMGGTSVGAPLVAGIEAHASTAVKDEPGAEAFYTHTLFDVTSGTTGWCGSYMCTAQEGYDGPTGWGSPDGPLEKTVGLRAVTDPATNLTTANGTELNGYVDPGGSETSYYHFEYGPTTSYGVNVPVPSASVGSGSIWRSVSESISGLAAETTYHYRLVAANSNGTVYGKDHTFTTPRWSIQATPHPSKSEASDLNDVSCTSANACTAVGFNEESTGSNMLAERWSGTEWAIQTTPGKGELQGVSCASETVCTAVGRVGSLVVPLAEQWEGGKWTAETIPDPSLGAASFAELKSVSCTSPKACTAVGYYRNSSAAFVTLAEFWNGTQWEVQSTPNPSGDSQLLSVSCTSSESCTAVGYYEESLGFFEGLVEHWNGTAWSQQKIAKPPTITPGSALTGVACSTSSTCIAVGYYQSGSATNVTWAEEWNGTEWTIQDMPNPAGATIGSYLLGLSCASSKACTAVGRYGTSPTTSFNSAEVTLSEHWNGTKWTFQATPNPNQWTVEDIPNPTYGINSLTGVSCTAEEVCSAVGSGEETFGPQSMLAERIALPGVETHAAANITESSATLKGSVNPGGLETTYHFEYGTEKGVYTHKTEEASAGSGTSNVEESTAIAGLAAITTYYYRIVATSGGMVYGSEKALTTMAPSLPYIGLGEGGSFPVALEGSSSAAVKISNTVRHLTCEGVKSGDSITGAKAVNVSMEFTNCASESVKCNTTGAGAGVAVLSGSAGVVYINKAERLVGTIVTLNASEIACGTTKVKVRGSILVPITPIGTLTKQLDLTLTGSGEGRPTYATYENEKGEEKEAKLELNFGTGYKTAALEIAETLKLNASEEVMVRAVEETVRLPKFALDEGGSFPVALEGSSSAAVSISNSVKPFTCKGVKSSDSVTGPKAVNVEMEFSNCATKVGESSTKCNTAGAGAGVAILTGAASVVYYVEGSEIRPGMALTLNAGEIACGSVKVKVRGSILIPTTPFNEETNQFDIALRGNGEGDPTYTAYENEKGEAEEAKLELNFGTGYKKAALEVAETLKLAASKTLILEA